jgi:hypothetical protein
MHTNITGHELANDMNTVVQAIPAGALAELVAKYKAAPKALSAYDVTPYAKAQGIGADGLCNALYRLIDAGKL